MSYIIYEVAEHEIHDLLKIENIIDNNKDLTHVFGVYCETNSGILNPIKLIADIVPKKYLSFFIFGEIYDFSEFCVLAGFASGTRPVIAILTS